MTTVFDVPADLLIEKVAEEFKQNDNVIEEIKRQLKANEIVKLKFAKNIARDKDKYIDEIVSKTKSKLIDVRGHVAVIYKKKP